jgi:hypothetical protein
VPKGRWWRGICGLALVVAAVGSTPAPARGAASRAARATAPRTPVVTIYPNDPAGPKLIGLGVEWDPYDTFRPTPAAWEATFSRVAYMQPGFIRVVEPASGYFKGYDALDNPTYRWRSAHVRELLKILAFAQTHGITVVLGDWANPLIDGDPRIPADFIAQLQDDYGFTNIRYYDPINEPNYDNRCDFSCWTGVMSTLSNEFNQLNLGSSVQLVGPDNGNSWDDTASAQTLDQTAGLDGDNPITDVWVTQTLQTIPSLIGAYDSHRYATIWGIKHGVYEDQMRSRREEITNLDSPLKPYFEAEVGIAARQVSPFSGDLSSRQAASVAALFDPSAHTAMSPFVDSQPHIGVFDYGVWMGDMAIQAIDGGLSGASAWDLDDAMHVGGGYGSQNLKQWGFWNSLGGTDGYPTSDLSLRPWYYTWSLLSRSFPAGSQALTVPSTNVPGLRVAAAKVADGAGHAFSFAIVNDSHAARTVKLAVPSVAGAVTLARYDYFRSDRPTDANGFPTAARILRGVELPRGLTIRLPSRGLVILSSLPVSSGASISTASRTLVDNLDGWGRTYRRSRGLRLDTSNPMYFNGARSRVTPSRKGIQYLIYRGSGMTSFELKAYVGAKRGIRVSASRVGGRWTQVGLSTTDLAPTVGGHGWYLDDLLPSAPLPAGTDELRIEFMNRQTELSQVRIYYRG